MLNGFDGWLIIGVLFLLLAVAWRVIREEREEHRRKQRQLCRQLQEAREEIEMLHSRLGALQSHRGEIIDCRIDMAKEETERLHQKIVAKDVLLEQYRRQIQRGIVTE